MEQVRVCRFCGHVSPADRSVTRCANCDSFSGLTELPMEEARRLARRRRLGFLRSRLLRVSLAAAVILLVSLWVLGIYFDLGASPPAPTTRVSSSVGPGTWAQSRRTPQNTGYTPEPAPRPGRVKWTYVTAGPIISSPAVAGGRVFLATEDGRALALDQETGRQVWEYPTGVPSSSSPAVAGELVYVGLRPGRLLALDRDTGSLRWEKKFDDPILASPVIDSGTLYIGGADRKLHALDAVTGAERWTFTSSDWIISEVALEDDAVVVASQASLVHVLDSRTGKQRLVYNGGRGRSAAGGTTVRGNLVYFGSYGGRVWAIDRRARSYPWDGTILFWKSNFYIWGLLGAPPTQRGSIWAMEMGGDVTSTPSIDRDTVYVASLQGRVVALDALTGKPRWSTQLDYHTSSSPTVAGNTLLIGTQEGQVLGLDAATGEVMWQFHTGGRVTAAPIVVGDTMYVASHDGNLYAVAGDG